MSVNINSGISFRVVCYACILFFVLGAILGFWCEAKFFPTVATNTVEKTNELQPVFVKGETKTVTEVQYVEKEKDPDTGKAEPTDVQVNVGQSVVTVMVNGKPHQFALLRDETQKFEKGKIVLDQTSKLDMDIKIPTVDTTRKNAIGPYMTSESWGLVGSRETERHRILLLAGKKWDDKNGRQVELGGAWQMKF